MVQRDGGVSPQRGAGRGAAGAGRGQRADPAAARDRQSARGLDQAIDGYAAPGALGGTDDPRAPARAPRPRHDGGGAHPRAVRRQQALSGRRGRRGEESHAGAGRGDRAPAGSAEDAAGARRRPGGRQGRLRVARAARVSAGLVALRLGQRDLPGRRRSRLRPPPAGALAERDDPRRALRPGVRAGDRPGRERGRHRRPPGPVPEVPDRLGRVVAEDPMMEMIEWKIQLGTLVAAAATVFSVLVTGLGLWLRQTALHRENLRRFAAIAEENVRQFTEVKTKVEAMWKWFEAKLERMNGK